MSDMKAEDPRFAIVISKVHDSYKYSHAHTQYSCYSAVFCSHRRLFCVLADRTPHPRDAQCAESRLAPSHDWRRVIPAPVPILRTRVRCASATAPLLCADHRTPPGQCTLCTNRPAHTMCSVYTVYHHIRGVYRQVGVHSQIRMSLGSIVVRYIVTSCQRSKRREHHSKQQ